MKIVEATVRRYAEPEGGDFEILVVELRTDTELTGRGYQMLFGVPGEFAAGLIETRLAPEVLGLDPWLTGLAWQRMTEAMPRRGSDGMVRGSIAALDMALWDLTAKRAGLPLYRLLGLPRRCVWMRTAAGRPRMPDT